MLAKIIFAMVVAALLSVPGVAADDDPLPLGNNAADRACDAVAVAALPGFNTGPSGLRNVYNSARLGLNAGLDGSEAVCRQPTFVINGALAPAFLDATNALDGAAGISVICIADCIQPVGLQVLQGTSTFVAAPAFHLGGLSTSMVAISADFATDRFATGQALANYVASAQISMPPCDPVCLLQPTAFGLLDATDNFCRPTFGTLCPPV